MIACSQDVVTFLSWAAEPEMDERKLMGTKWLAVLSLVRCGHGGFSGWVVSAAGLRGCLGLW